METSALFLHWSPSSATAAAELSTACHSTTARRRLRSAAVQCSQSDISFVYAVFSSYIADFSYENDVWWIPFLRTWFTNLLRSVWEEHV